MIVRLQVRPFQICKDLFCIKFFNVHWGAFWKTFTEVQTNRVILAKSLYSIHKTIHFHYLLRNFPKLQYAKGFLVFQYNYKWIQDAFDFACRMHIYNSWIINAFGLSLCTCDEVFIVSSSHNFPVKTAEVRWHTEKYFPLSVPVQFNDHIHWIIIVISEHDVYSAKTFGYSHRKSFCWTCLV